MVMNKSFLLKAAYLSSKFIKILEHDKGGWALLVGRVHKDTCPIIIQ